MSLLHVPPDVTTLPSSALQREKAGGTRGMGGGSDVERKGGDDGWVSVRHHWHQHCADGVTLRGWISVRGWTGWVGGRGTAQHGTARHSHRTPWSPRSLTAILRCDLQSSRSVSAACPDPQLRFHVCSNGVSPTDVASTVTATGSAACDPAAAPTPAATTPRHHNNIAETQNVASCCTILNFNLAKLR